MKNMSYYINTSDNFYGQDGTKCMTYQQMVEECCRLAREWYVDADDLMADFRPASDEEVLYYGTLDD